MGSVCAHWSEPWKHIWLDTSAEPVGGRGILMLFYPVI